MEGQKIVIRNSSSSEELVHPISILLVDDDSTYLSNVATLLKKFKYEVVTARHPQDAIYTLRLKKWAFDLVVSDVHMPDMDGFELQKAIAQEFDLPVVLMFGDDQDSSASKGLDHGGAFFIPKTVSADDLRDIWRFAKKRKITADEAGSLPEPETPSMKINLDEIITISDSSADVEKDLKKKSLGKRVSNENREVNSASPSPKKRKLNWTNSLHNCFLEAIRKIGLDKAVPKRILEVMNVPGLRRENVASHLQKYRIFLRRVSNPSFEIPYGSGESSTHRFISRITLSGSNSSTPILNKISRNNHQHPWRFPNSNMSAASSSILTGSTYSRILSNKGNFCKPSVTSSNLLVHDTDRSHIRYGENSSKAAVEKTTALDDLPRYGRLASFTNPSSRENIGTSSDGVSMEPSKIFTPRSNFVGYRISNLQSLAESGLFQNDHGVEANGGLVDLPNAEIHRNNLGSEADSLDEHSYFDDLLDQLLADSSDTPSAPDNNGENQFSDVIADYQKLISNSDLSPQNGMANGDACSPLFDWDEFDILSNEQSFDGIELYHSTTLQNPASFGNHEKAHEDHQCLVFQEFEATHQLSETHRSLDEQQARMKTDVASTQVEEEEFLESLFANLPEELMESNFYTYI